MITNLVDLLKRSSRELSVESRNNILKNYCFRHPFRVASHPIQVVFEKHK
jgi:hypothetical protein